MQRELRKLTRYRTTLMQERAAEVNRLQKTLEGANIKLAADATDVLGKSGRQIQEALVAGTSQAGDLAQLAKGRMRDKIPQLERALKGSFRQHQQFMVARHLAFIDAIDELVAQATAEIAKRLRPAERLRLASPAPGPCRPNSRGRRDKHHWKRSALLDRSHRPDELESVQPRHGQVSQH